MHCLRVSDPENPWGALLGYDFEQIAILLSFHTQPLKRTLLLPQCAVRSSVRMRLVRLLKQRRRLQSASG